MPEAPRISVALCTFNGARYLQEQVESLCAQTLPPCELVVRDDGSSDGSADLVRRTWERCLSPEQRAAMPLRITVNPARLGVAANFEAALRECTGDFVALCDQDDRWPPQRLERLWQHLQAHPQAWLVHCDARLIGPDGQPLDATLFQALGVTSRERERLRQGRAFEVALDRNLVTGAATLLRRELLDAALPIPPHWIHDEWLGAVAAAMGRACTLVEPWLEYRQHGANQIGARRRTLLEEARRLFAPAEGQPDRLARARELVARLERLGDLVPAEHLALAREKVEHHAARAALPAARWKRTLPILREAARGRYQRYGRGWRGILKDWLEPG